MKSKHESSVKIQQLKNIYFDNLTTSCAAFTSSCIYILHLAKQLSRVTYYKQKKNNFFLAVRSLIDYEYRLPNTANFQVDARKRISMLIALM